MNRYFIDSDVILDVLVNREDFYQASADSLALCSRPPNKGMVSWHSVANIYYVIRHVAKHAAADKQIDNLLQLVEVCTVANQDMHFATKLAMKDFEDALQVASAIAGTCECIITRNKRDYPKALLPVYTPKEFLQIYA